MTDPSQPSKPENIRCEQCEGTGQLIRDCEECSGNGWVDDPSDGGTMTCPACGDEKCEACDGTGEKP